MRKKRIILLVVLSLVLLGVVSFCLSSSGQKWMDAVAQGIDDILTEQDMGDTGDPDNPVSSANTTKPTISAKTGEELLRELPEYSGEPAVVVNDNEPFFMESEMVTEAFEYYSPLDELGRCGVAYANICIEVMPTEDRGSISSVKPTGWHTTKYDVISGKYLYHRCHLIGYQLAGENANKLNLITGTGYMNVTGMLPYENQIADYVKKTENHVIYRVTPIFDKENLVAHGVLMEAKSVEDDGEGVMFCVFCYNVQPGIKIDYASGESSLADEEDTSSTDDITYVLNTKTKKFHLPSCSLAKKLTDSNKEEVTWSRKKCIDEGYEACGTCKP